VRHTPDGVLHFSLNLDVDMRELREWTPAELGAFFAGIARAQEAASVARTRLVEKAARELRDSRKEATT
jgi:hypothetical protein